LNTTTTLSVRPERSVHIHSCPRTRRELITVSVSNRFETTLYRDDYAVLLALGLSPSWFIWRSGYVATPAPYSPNGHVNVARVLLDAGEGEVVRYVDSDKLNLRRENLLIEPGFALRRDRAALTPAHKSRRKISPAL
jgi:hypothetical protein